VFIALRAGAAAQSVPDDMFNQSDVVTLAQMGAVEPYYFNITQFPGGQEGVLHTKFMISDSKGVCCALRLPVCFRVHAIVSRVSTPPPFVSLSLTAVNVTNPA
jgi:hypothetical protein